MVLTLDDVGVPEGETWTDEKKQEILDYWNIDRSYKKWEQAMLESDTALVSRMDEDIYDVLSEAQQSSLATESRDKIQAKKDLRATMPPPPPVD